MPADECRALEKQALICQQVWVPTLDLSPGRQHLVELLTAVGVRYTPGQASSLDIPQVLEAEGISPPFLTCDRIQAGEDCFERSRSLGWGAGEESSD